MTSRNLIVFAALNGALSSTATTSARLVRKEPESNRIAGARVTVRVPESGRGWLEAREERLGLGDRLGGEKRERQPDAGGLL